MTNLLEATGISKSYGTNRVLCDVSLTVSEGEIVSIVGENGAGKSTLGKILAGITPPDAGTIRWRGRSVSFEGPGDAIDAGIGIVHQELSLIDTLTIAENISLGREPLRYGFLDRNAMRECAGRALARLHSDLAPDRLVGSLSTAQKQLVEIARALSYNSHLIIFDEPTSSLSDHDGELLLSVITHLRKSGISSIYVSHRLSEVTRISDRAVALKDGRNSGDRAAPNIDHNGLISLIVGRELNDMYGYRPRTRGAPALTITNLRPTAKHTPSTFTVHSGEIVGIAGLIGSGRTELLEAVYGVRRVVSGSIDLHGSQHSIRSPHDACRAGIALVPEDRKEQGIVSSFSIKDSVALNMLGGSAPRLLRSRRDEWASAKRQIESLGVRCTGPAQPIGELSGGNQQKIVLGKCLSIHPTVLLLDEPTRGVDVGARREIYSQLFTLAEQGMAILFVSSEMEEAIGIADRLFVMSEGAITGEISREAFSEEAIMKLASPHPEEAA
jgi:ribose transport system ATP-binding protein